MQKMLFVAIATASHLGFAVRTLRSVQGKSIHRRLIMIGASKVKIGDVGNDIEVQHAEEIVGSEELRKMVTRYMPAEVCFALKPYVMASALHENFTSVHYVDSDIKFYSSVDDFEDHFNGNDILLTPHYIAPYPHDGRTPRVLTLLRAGVFNAGYVGVRKSKVAAEFLAWWGRSVLAYGKNEPRSGMCGDQRWLDLVPAMFERCQIWRHPGANVGYWNLHERHLTLEEEKFKSNGDDLLFFHFSGYDPETPNQISRFQNRLDISTGSSLSYLLTDYAQGYREAAQGGISNAYAYHKWWQRETRIIRALRDKIRRDW